VFLCDANVRHIKQLCSTSGFAAQIAGACDGDPDKFVWNEFEQWSEATLAQRA
jgi:hypothetical protein